MSKPSASLVKFNLHGYGTKITAFDFVTEFVSEYGSTMVPIYNRATDDILVWQQIFVDSLIKFIGKKTVNGILSMIIPKEWIDQISGLKYVGDGVLNVLVGTLTRYLATYFGISTIPFDNWTSEAISEVKTELIKQGIIIAVDGMAN